MKRCMDGKPHCFSSTPETYEDNELFNADYGTTAGNLVDPSAGQIQKKRIAQAFAQVDRAFSPSADLQWIEFDEWDEAAVAYEQVPI